MTQGSMLAGDGVPRRRDRRGGIVAGCLIALGVAGLLLAIGIFWFSQNWRWIVANPTRAAMVEMVEQSSLPEDQRQRIIAEIDTVAEDFKSGKITLEQMQRLGEEIGESPLVPIAAVYFLDDGYFEKSGLTEEEKTEGRLALNRYARGVYEGDIARSDVERVLDPIADTSGESVELRPAEKVTDEELLELIRRAREKADQVDVPNERWEIDFASEFSAAIDRALGRAGSGDSAQGATTDRDGTSGNSSGPEADGQPEPSEPATGGGG